MKYVQSKTKNKFCSCKCVKQFSQMCSFSVTFLHSLNLLFLLLYISFLLLYLSFHLVSLYSYLDFSHFSHFHPDLRPTFYENGYFSSKTNTPFCHYCITLGTKSLFTSSETSSVISPKESYLKVPEIYNL